MIKRMTYNLAMNRLRDNPRNRDRSFPDEEPSGSENVFDQEWGCVCLDEVWRRLEKEEVENPYPDSPPFYSVLHIRADHEEGNSADLAKLLGSILGVEVTTEKYRQWLLGARSRFAIHLLEVMEQQLGDNQPVNLINELEELGLYDYCKSALESRGLLPRAGW